MAINISIDQGQIESLSPTLLGSEPVVFTLNGIEYSVLTEMFNGGLDLFNSLDNKQKNLATGLSIPREVVTGPREDGLVPKQVGIFSSQLNEQQQTQFLAIIKKCLFMQLDETTFT